MLNISFLGGYISQDSSSQNYTESAYYNSNSDLNGNAYGEVSGANANSENWDQLEKPTYNYYAQNSSTESSLYKTKLCRHFIAKGYCNLGERNEILLMVKTNLGTLKGLNIKTTHGLI